MFIISDKLIINCDNVTNISYHYLDEKYKVIAFYGYDNWDCIIEVDTEEQAKEVIKQIVEHLAKKEEFLTVSSLIVSYSELSTNELMQLFRHKSKKVIN